MTTPKKTGTASKARTTSGSKGTRRTSQSQPSNKPAMDELTGIYEAIKRSQAVVEFDLEGKVLAANQIFLDVVGFSLEEIQGQHHGMLVHPDLRDSQEYAEHWERLRSGEFISGEFHRIGKGGHDVHLQATYSPVMDAKGNVAKVVKFATDITAQKLTELSNKESQEWFTMEVQRIADACRQGQLDERGDTDGLNDLFRPLMDNLNEVLDLLVTPVKRTASYLSVIAEGEIPDEITDQAHGDFETMQSNLNWLILATQSITDIAKRIGQGDFTVEVQNRSDKDELLLALQKMVDQLNESMCSIRGTANEVLDQSRGVSTDSQSLSQSAAESAASLEQISSSMEELASQTRNNADNARQAMQLAISARDAATQGDSQMKSMVQAMQEIEEASESISKIIKVIDEIAFQTNLLALNAAVEAARAGVHGKGFAVVAEEVRNLAARSATAARETTDLIEGTVKKVTNGMGIADETATALGQIVTSVSKAADLVSEISAASNEQTDGIDQVNVGINQVDQATQHNTASADRMSSSALQLKQQAEELLETVGRFQLIEPQTPEADEVPGDVLKLLEQILAGQGPKGVEQLKTALLGSTRTASPETKSPQTCGAPASTPAGTSANPADVIRLDDDDFGRYGQ